MLQCLFNNRSVERILLFLLVNERCYAHQIHKLLSIPQTPIQHALNKLEQGGLLQKIQDGKISWFTFNKDFPLLTEVEALLKKAYSLLDFEEQKAYYSFGSPSTLMTQNNRELLHTTWDALKNVSQVTLLVSCYSKRGDPWQREGIGKVAVNMQGKSVEFHEEGYWKEATEITNKYFNIFRWTPDYRKYTLTLEHLRQGKNHPVSLFELLPKESNIMQSDKPFLCGEDTYYGWLEHHDRHIQLTVRTIGPSKNEEIKYIYT